MAGPGNYARAQQLAADAADPRNPAAHRAELRELAQVHATLALAEAVGRLALREAAPGDAERGSAGGGPAA